MERVRSRIVSTGLFDRSRTLVTRRGVIWGDVRLREDDRFVHVAWHNADIYPSEPGRRATPKQASALRRLDRVLAHPAAWLPTSAWEDRKNRAYVPSTYIACYEVLPKEFSAPPSDPSRIFTVLPTAAADLLRSRDRIRHEGHRGLAVGPFYAYHYDCSEVTTKEVRALVKALDGAGVDHEERAHRLAYRIKILGPKRETAHLSFEPVLPHGETTCSVCG